MGLDTVELVIRFEDAFGIAIPNEVAAQLTTPREVTDYVIAQVAVSEQPSCLSQQAFYFLRAKLVPSLKISRKDFSPNTRLDDLVPLKHRRQVWEGIRSEIGPSTLPDLKRPMWLFSLLSVLTVLAFIYAVIHAMNNFEAGSDLSFIFGLFLAIAVGYGGAIVTRPCKRHFLREYSCAGDLARYLMANSLHTFKKEKTGWTREQVAAVIREIVIDQAGTKDFTEGSHFINDMHLD
jgi:hypothetical protein